MRSFEDPPVLIYQNPHMTEEPTDTAQVVGTCDDRRVSASCCRVLIIVPAYNEADTLPQLLSELQAVCAGCDIVVIDDGSTDNTKAVLRKFLVRLVSLPCNLGIGGAVQTGLQIALAEEYDIAVQVDGDGQHPPREVGKLLEAVLQSDCDMVIGTRFRTRQGYQSTFGRRLGVKIFSWLLSGLCHTRITDATSGFRAMNQRAIRILARCYAEDYPEVEALLVVHRAGLRITEVAVQMAERQAGRSSIGVLQGISYMVKVLLAIFMNLVREPDLLE